MRPKTMTIAALIGSVILGAATTAEDPIAQRRQIMRGNARAENKANNLILGKYSAAKAIEAMKTLEENLTVFPTLFPEGTDTGDTHALPAIWTNMDDFKSLAARLVNDAKAAEAAATEGQDAFAVAWQAVAEDCNSCHTKYQATGQ
jgi:cytochrome c556